MSEAVAALMRELEPAQSARLTAAVAQITAAAVQRFGVSPTLEEVVATAMAKEATFGDGSSFDIENALHQLSAEAPSVVRHMRLKEARTGELPEGVEGKRFAESGVVTDDDIEALPPYLRGRVRVGMTAADFNEMDSGSRMMIARALTLDHGVRNPTVRDVRDRDVAAYEDSRPLEDMSPGDRMAYARRNGLA